MSGPERVTVHDVARRANLSIASVSRALTGSRPVRPDVAERVQRAARELGYQANPIARSLRGSRTQTIGLAVADITNPFFPALVKAVERAARDAEYGLLFADAENDPAVERQRVSLLLTWQVDALLISPTNRTRSRATVAAAAQRVPVVQLDRRAGRSAYVGIDHAQAIADLLTHLAATGRRHPAFIGADPSVSSSWERQRAFVRHAAALDRFAPDRVLSGAFSAEWGEQAAAEALKRWPSIDALVCADDLIAIGVLRHLRHRGIPVPDAIAVTGFDDTALATASSPRLTSVAQPLLEMATRALAIAGTADLGHTEATSLPATVVVRESTVPDPL